MDNTLGSSFFRPPAQRRSRYQSKVIRVWSTPKHSRVARAASRRSRALSFSIRFKCPSDQAPCLSQAVRVNMAASLAEPIGKLLSDGFLFLQGVAQQKGVGRHCFLSVRLKL